MKTTYLVRDVDVAGEHSGCTETKTPHHKPHMEAHSPRFQAEVRVQPLRAICALRVSGRPGRTGDRHTGSLEAVIGLRENRVPRTPERRTEGQNRRWSQGNEGVGMREATHLVAHVGEVLQAREGRQMLRVGGRYLSAGHEPSR